MVIVLPIGEKSKKQKSEPTDVRHKFNKVESVVFINTFCTFILSLNSSEWLLKFNNFL